MNEWGRPSVADSDDHHREPEPARSGCTGSNRDQNGSGLAKNRAGRDGARSRCESARAHDDLPPPLSRTVLSDRDWQRIRTAFGLSARELEVVQHFFEGDTEARIAYRLGLTLNTVHTYVRRIYEKIGAHDQKEAILRVVAQHLAGLSPE